MIRLLRTRLARRVILGVRLGRLSNGVPVSVHFGFDRGTPIDRVFIERFLDEHRGVIRGVVLEVGDDAYSRRLGGAAVMRTDVLDVDAGNERATVIGDLVDLKGVADQTYDCVILTQVLQYVEDPRRAMEEVHRILRPEGGLLLTAPGIIPVHGRTEEVDRWRFTPVGIEGLARGAFGPGAIIVAEGHGDLASAAAFLAGLSAEELDRPADARDDQRYPLLVTLRAVRSPSP